MRIACVDRTATDRLKLEQLLEDGFRECRRTIGHLLVAKFYPSSREEALVNTPPNILILGPALGIDEALNFLRDWKSLYPELPVFIFISEENYSLKNLKRLEDFVLEVFCIADKPSRYVYSITSMGDVSKRSNKGRLIVAQGVKGGVGVTTVVGGLAHAFQDLGKSVVVVDLSKGGIFSQFMLSDKWQSSEFSEILAEGILPDSDKVERLLVTLKNGLQVLPPPSGAGELRELYVRDSERLEVPLFIIDRLIDLYDVVVVDTANTEGILTFALSCRADTRLIVTGNDTGSVHLLSGLVSDFDSLQDGQTKILINRLVPKGLNKEDVLDFVSWSPNFDEAMLFEGEIPYEERASMWIGTGNTIFTEGSRKIRNILKSLSVNLLGELEDNSERKRLSFKKTLGLLGMPKKLEVIEDRREALPMLPLKADSVSLPPNLTESVSLSPGEGAELSYTPPKKVVNE